MPCLQTASRSWIRQMQHCLGAQMTGCCLDLYFPRQEPCATPRCHGSCAQLTSAMTLTQCASPGITKRRPRACGRLLLRWSQRMRAGRLRLQPLRPALRLHSNHLYIIRILHCSLWRCCQCSRTLSAGHTSTSWRILTMTPRRRWRCWPSCHQASATRLHRAACSRASRWTINSSSSSSRGKASASWRWWYRSRYPATWTPVHPGKTWTPPSWKGTTSGARSMRTTSYAASRRRRRARSTSSGLGMVWRPTATSMHVSSCGSVLR
mmetsp:Transcript_34400/g.76417  ORF Transcript_34400/g.76417 Transcript_34400/m.76417 type:complete len:265 (+) Transcript_34400:689-1483(+)